MYSTASPPPKKEGVEGSRPLQESKGGKPPTVWQRLSVFYQIIPVGATSEQKSGSPALREAPLRRGYFKSVPQAHRNSRCSRFTLHFITQHEVKSRHAPQFRGSPRNCSPQGLPYKGGACAGAEALQVDQPVRFREIGRIFPVYAVKGPEGVRVRLSRLCQEPCHPSPGHLAEGGFFRQGAVRLPAGKTHRITRTQKTGRGSRIARLYSREAGLRTRSRFPLPVPRARRSPQKA